MQIFIKLANHATVTLQVSPDTTVKQLKDKMKGFERVKHSQNQTLSYGGRQLIDSYTLSDYNI